MPSFSRGTHWAWGLVFISWSPIVPPGLSRDMVLGHLGANITLTCQDKVSANATVLWQVEEQGAAGGWGRRLAEGNMLLLRRLRYEDSGRYSCSVGSHLLRSLHLLVAGGSTLGGMSLAALPVMAPVPQHLPALQSPLKLPRSPATGGATTRMSCVSGHSRRSHPQGHGRCSG